MSTKLVTSNVWSRITRAAKASPSKAHVAVAYFGAGAGRLLPLKKGSRLVVDMSKAAVASGQTNPSEIISLISKGIDVYSVPNLHAKVFVFGSRAFVGSANASQNSASALVEAVMETTTPAVVRAARQFVREQSFRLVTPDYARRMARYYKPPKFGVGPRHREPAAMPEAPVVHVIHLKYVDFTEDEDRFHEQQTAIARKQRRRPRASRVEGFRWQGRCQVKEEDIVMQVTDEGRGRKLVSPQGNVLRVRRYRKSSRPVWFVYVELPKGHRRKNLKSVVRRLGQKAKRYLSKDRIIRDGAFVRSLLGLWHAPNRRKEE